MTTQWIVICHTGERSSEGRHGPYASVSDAAHGVPLFMYTATLLPVIDGVQQCVEDNEASMLFANIRKRRLHCADPVRIINHHIDRATEL